MLRRRTYIEDNRVLADSGECTTDIRVRDPITALWIEFKANNGSTSNVDNTLIDAITQISVVDGSTVLFSATGYEAWAVGAYRTGYIIPQAITEVSGATQTCVIPILFGRYVGDPSYAFDPGRFRNPQIRIEWNLGAVRSVGATGFETGTLRYTVVADVMEGAAGASQLIGVKRHYSFVTAASGWEYIDMPTDAPYVSLYLRSYEAGVGQLSNISTIRLNCDQNKFVPFDEGTDDFLRSLQISYPPFSYRHTLLKASGDTAYFLLKYDERVAYLCAVADGVVTATNTGIGEQTLAVYVAGTASTTARRIDAAVQGYLPVSTVRITFGDPYSPDEWFDTSLWRSIRLELEQSGAGGVASVLVEQPL